MKIYFWTIFAFLSTLLVAEPSNAELIASDGLSKRGVRLHATKEDVNGRNTIIRFSFQCRKANGGEVKGAARIFLFDFEDHSEDGVREINLNCSQKGGLDSATKRNSVSAQAIYRKPLSYVEENIDIAAKVSSSYSTAPETIFNEIKKEANNLIKDIQKDARKLKDEVQSKAIDAGFVYLTAGAL